MKLPRPSHLVVAGLLVMNAACIPSTPSEKAPEPTPATEGAAVVPSRESLMAEWRAMAKNAKAHFDDRRALVLGVELAKLGPDGLTPLLDLLADPAGDPAAKVLAAISLRSVVKPELLGRLESMTSPENDATTRACATDLISCLPNPEAVLVLKRLSSDAERRVRLAAMVGLVRHHDVDVHTELRAFFQQADVTLNERTAVAAALAEAPLPEDCPVLAAAAADEKVNLQTRVLCAKGLGSKGDSSVLDALTACTGEGVEAPLRDMAQAAIDAIKSRAAASG